MATQDIDITIYNGTHRVEFKNGTHRYYIDGKPQQGVTTIMGKVLAKPGLMLWPLSMAVKHIKENCWYEPADKCWYVTEADLEAAQKAHVVRRDKGADTGTILHSLVEKRLSQNVGYTVAEIAELASQSEQSGEIAMALGAFEAWMTKTKPKTILVEQVVYSSSEGYAGTYDSILEIDGKVYLCDLKTTNAGRSAPQGIYPENFIQLGAYYNAYEEQRQFETKNGGTMLRMIDDLMIISCKKDGKLDIGTASDLGLTLEDCQDMWRSTFLLYNKLGKLSKKLGGK